MVKDRETCARFGYMIADPRDETREQLIPRLPCYVIPFPPHSEMDEA